MTETEQPLQTRIVMALMDIGALGVLGDWPGVSTYLNDLDWEADDRQFLLSVLIASWRMPISIESHIDTLKTRYVLTHGELRAEKLIGRFRKVSQNQPPEAAGGGR